jgi:hypothetical protein
MKTVDHSASNRAIAAFLKRDSISKAATAWMATEPNDDADIEFEIALMNANIVQFGDQVDEIWSDAPETVMVRVNESTLIEIDIESGSYMRGQAD